MVNATGREVFAPIPGTNEVWTVAGATAKGTALIQGTRAGVALGNSGESTFTTAIGSSGISITGPNGAAGYAALEVGAHTTGTFEFSSITGVTTSTAQGALVYITSGGDLTTTSTSNTFYGFVNYPKGYTKATGKAPIKIGA